MKTSGLLAMLLACLTSPLLAADGSLSFDGAGDYIEVPNFQNLGVSSEFTVEFWAKTNTTAPQSAFMLSPDDGNHRFQAHLSHVNGGTFWGSGEIVTTGRMFYRLKYQYSD